MGFRGKQLNMLAAGDGELERAEEEEAALQPASHLSVNSCSKVDSVLWFIQTLGDNPTS